jgi:hypothetical protein
MQASDTACARLWKCSEAEQPLMEQIMSLSDYRFTEMPIEALQDLLQAQRMMLKAAGYLGRFVDRVGGLHG